MWWLLAPWFWYVITSIEIDNEKRIIVNKSWVDWVTIFASLKSQYADNIGFICQLCGLVRSKEEIKAIASEIKSWTDKALTSSSSQSILLHWVCNFANDYINPLRHYDIPTDMIRSLEFITISIKQIWSCELTMYGVY